MPTSNRLAGIVILALAAGCGRGPQPTPAVPAPVTKPAPPTPIDIKRAEIGGPMWDPAWDAIVEQALPPEMLSAQAARDVHPFCPRFAALGEPDKREFWAYFFQALAGAEAGLKPTSHPLHAQPAMQVKDPVTGTQVRPEGLLQLAYEDERRYGCDFSWENDRTLRLGDPARTILQPKNNLECGVKILDHQLFQEHRALLAHTEYWSTLQPGTVSYRVFAKQMANVPAACGARRQPARQPPASAASQTAAARLPPAAQTSAPGP